MGFPTTQLPPKSAFGESVAYGDSDLLTEHPNGVNPGLHTLLTDILYGPLYRGRVSPCIDTSRSFFRTTKVPVHAKLRDVYGV